MKKDGFIIYSSWLPAVEALPDADVGILFKAVMRYASGEDVNTDELPTSVIFPFKLFTSKIDGDSKKWMMIREKRIEAGKRRAEKAKAENAHNSEHVPANANTCYQVIPNDSIEAGLGKGKGKGKGNTSSLRSEEVIDNISSSLHSEDNNKNNIIIRDANASTSSLQDDVSNSADIKRQIVDFWNRTMDGKAIPKVNGIRERREASLFARLRVYGIDAVYTVITKAAASSFLNGGGAKSFIANFDWVFRPNNFPKVLEGNYDDNDKPQANMNYGTTRQQRDDADRRQRAQAYATLDDYLINGSTVGR